MIYMLLYGFIIGLLVKIIHPGDENLGIINTMILGVLGTYFGGFLGWLLFGSSINNPNFFLSLAGGFLLCMLYANKESVISFIQSKISR